MKEYALTSDGVHQATILEANPARKELDDPIEDGIYRSILRELAGYGKGTFGLTQEDITFEFGERGKRVLKTLERDNLIVSQEA